MASVKVYWEMWMVNKSLCGPKFMVQALLFWWRW